MPGRFAYPVTGRIASASANIAAFLQPATPEDEKESAPLIEKLRRQLIYERQEVASLKNELHLLRKELETVAGIKTSSQDELSRIIPARVILRRDASNYRRTILVNRGSEHGVSPGLLALWGCEKENEPGVCACVVGIVDTVGPRACRIMLASDSGFRLPARMLETRRRVIVEGKSPGLTPIRIKHASPEIKASPGDMVVTSGSLGLYPSGILIGFVSRVEDSDYAPEMEILLASPVNLDELESVIIVELTPPDVPEENE